MQFLLLGFAENKEGIFKRPIPLCFIEIFVASYGELNKIRDGL